MYCYGYIHPQIGQGSVKAQRMTQESLDAFFPFDPLPLKRTGVTIDPLYQVWESLDDEDEEEHHREVEINNTLDYEFSMVDESILMDLSSFPEAITFSY